MDSRHVALALSLLIHLLLLSSFIVSWKFFPAPEIDKPEPKPAYYVPSYTKSENSQMSTPAPAAQQQQAMTPEKKVDTDKNGIEKKKVAQTTPATTSSTSSKPQIEQVSKASKDNDGVHLIGDKKIDRPLIKLLGTALSHSLIYPKIAIDFNLRGTVYVGFTLQPNGMVLSPKVVKSSGEQVLDDAATRAVRAMSPVVSVNQYLEKPKYLVVGIIFG